MSLETMLRDAYEAPVAFDPGDVQSRVGRRRRRRRALAGLGAVVLLALGAAGVVALTGDDGERSIITGPPEGEPQPIPITEEALVGSRWVQVASRGGNMLELELDEADTVNWIEFSDVGVGTSHGCGGGRGRWSIDSGRLNWSPLSSDLALCFPNELAYGGQSTLFSDGLLRFRGMDGDQAMEVELRRLDQMGERATTENLAGTWVAPGSGVPVTFGSDLEIDGCPFGAWQVEGTGLRVSGSTEGLACPNRTVDEEAVTSTAVWLTSTDEARVVDDELLLATAAATIRLRRATTAVTAADLTTSPWVATDVGIEVLALPRLHFEGDGSGDAAVIGEQRGSSFMLSAGCTTWTGTWRLDGGQIVLVETSRADGYCGQEQDVERGGQTGLDVEDGTVALIDGDQLVLGDGAGAVVFRPLDSFPPPTRTNLTGTWQTPSGFAVTFEEAGGVSAEAYSCRSGDWRLDGPTLVVTDRGQNCTFPNTSPVFGLLAPGAVLSVGLDGDRLYLVDNATAAVLDRADVPAAAPNEAEQLMIEAIADLGLEQCCGEPSHGGGGATIGFTMSGYDIWGGATPLVGSLPPDLSDTRTLEIGAVMGEDAEGTVIAFACGGFRITLREFVAAGELPSDVLQSAATGLIRVLPCAAVPDRG